MAKRTKKQSELTRQNIIDAAIIEFAENGFHNTSLSHISERAGVTRGAFYFYFKNKRDVFDVIWQEAVKIISDIEYESENKYPDSPLMVIKTVLKKHFNLIELMPSHKFRVKIITQIQDDNAELSAYYISKKELLFLNRDWLIKKLKACVDSGEIDRYTDINVMSIIINAYFVGVIQNYFFEPTLMNIKTNEKCVDSLISMMT